MFPFFFFCFFFQPCHFVLDDITHKTVQCRMFMLSFTLEISKQAGGCPPATDLFIVLPEVSEITKSCNFKPLIYYFC